MVTMILFLQADNIEKTLGIYLVLFGICIRTFLKGFMPGKIYVAATVIFFTLATLALSLDLVFRFTAPIPSAILFWDQPTASVLDLESYQAFQNFQSEGYALQSREIQSVPSYTFFIAGYARKKKTT